MAVSYNKLWKLLIDKNMKKKELGEAAGISNSLIAKLGKNENVTVEVLDRICIALNCNIEDIIEVKDNTTPKTDNKTNGEFCSVDKNGNAKTSKPMAKAIHNLPTALL